MAGRGDASGPLGPGGMTGSINQKLDAIMKMLAQQKRDSASTDANGRNVSSFFQNPAKLDAIVRDAREQNAMATAPSSERPALDLNLAEIAEGPEDSDRSAHI